MYTINKNDFASGDNSSNVILIVAVGSSNDILKQLDLYRIQFITTHCTFSQYMLKVQCLIQ
jgi:hypothetical protein